MTGRMMTMKLFLHGIKTFIWRERSRESAALIRYSIWFLRLMYVLGRDLIEGQLALRASSLSYTTLLSLVPLLAVSFSVLHAFGVYNMLEPLLLQFLEPLGPKGAEVGEKIISFVSNVRVGVLGSVGLAVLFYTVISLVNKIEKSFNFTWRVEENRSLGRRFSDYLSVILVGPVLMFSAIGLSASLMSNSVVQQLLTIEPFGTALYIAGKIIPNLLIVLAFSFIYVFIPNTKVKIVAAVGGALFATILWQFAGWAFASFIASSTKYAAIYSSFAILITFLIWLYLNWLIVLIGAQTAYYIQNPGSIREEHVAEEMSEELKEKLALLIMTLIAEHHYYRKPHWNMEQLAQTLGVAENRVQNLLQILEKQQLIIASADQPPVWIPARDTETISLDEVIFAVRRAGDRGEKMVLETAAIHRVEMLVRAVERLLKRCLSAKNVKELAVGVRYKGNDDTSENPE